MAAGDRVVSMPRAAASPAQAEMLALLDELRADVIAGRTISLVAIPIQTQREFVVRAEGALGGIELAGVLGCAWADAVDLARK